MCLQNKKYIILQHTEYDNSIHIKDSFVAPSKTCIDILPKAVAQTLSNKAILELNKYLRRKQEIYLGY